jgi:hypothetical protein
MSDGIRNDRQAVYNYLMVCGPLVKVSTGAVIKGMVHADYVVVHDAPPRVTREIISNFKGVGLTEGLGLLIPLEPAPKN